MIYQYPLQWPPGVPRTDFPARSRFDTPEERVKIYLEHELDMLGVANAVVTSNSELRRDGRPYANQRASDQGVAVHFVRDGRQQVIACDRWDSIRDNLQAVAKTVEALRGIDRWGTGEMVDAAFAGFTALPAAASGGIAIVPDEPWYSVLHVTPDAPPDTVEMAYKAALKRAHPDTGGSEAEFLRVQKAYKESQMEVQKHD